MNNRECEEFHDLKYKGWNYTIAKYKWARPKNTMPEQLEKAMKVYIDGWWCGYVMVPEPYKHPQDEYNLWNDDLRVHGGITYQEKFHLKESKNYNKYAIGFDFAKYHDNGGSKKLAIAHCRSLIKQILRIYLDAEHDLKEGNILT